MNEMSVFARDIMHQKYSHIKEDDSKESWDEIAERVVNAVMSTPGVEVDDYVANKIKLAIKQKKFMPGGRYLRSAGNLYHQTQNCALFRVEDSREGWSELLYKSSMSLMSGAGVGVVYSDLRAKGQKLKKTGGVSTGPLALMQMINENGRGIMNGGDRRAAIWAGLHWSHPDVMDFIKMKNWSDEVRKLKAKDYNFPATMDMTNISVILDDEFFEYYNSKFSSHGKVKASTDIFNLVVRQMLETGEPGFSIDIGKNTGENLRNAPIVGDTYVLTKDGYKKVIDIVSDEVEVWTGKRWAKTIFKKTGELENTIKVTFSGGRSTTCSPEHPFIVDGKRVEAQDLISGNVLTVSLPDILDGDELNIESDLNKCGYTMGYIYGDGSFNNKYSRAEASFCTPESKECIKGLDRRLISSITEIDSRGYSRVYFKNSGFFGGANKQVFPEYAYQMGTDFTRSFIAGLFDSDGNYYKPQNRVRLASIHKEFLRGVSRLLEGLGILSTITKGGISTYGQKEGYLLNINAEYINRFRKIIPTIRLKIDEHKAYRKTKIRVINWQHDKPQDVYCCDVGVEEHSFMAEGVIISNCTEITSSDDSDICNLGSINLARISSLEEMEEIVELGTIFLLAGTLYSHVPTEQIRVIRDKNRRLGLGLMGIHEWLLINGHKYGPNEELEKYLKIYERSTEISHKYAKRWNISLPIKTRAIAPTGTIGIVAETTTGIEPIFCVAYKRRYLNGDKWHYQYVIDPTAKRLIDMGIQPSLIEDAYVLSENVERRLSFQAWIQEFVDHAISSTINMPAWGSEFNNESRVTEFGNMLMKYLPRLRGITVYPDGCRDGQPLTPVKYETAIKHKDKSFEETPELVYEAVDICSISGKGGSCGS